MSDKQNTFVVVFRGDIVIGENLIEVKQRLQKLFNTDEQRIDTLFIGKPVKLKQGLSETEAQKYQQVLKKAGIVTLLEAEGEAAPQKPSGQSALSLQPLNAAQTTPKQRQAPVEVSVDHLSIAPAEGNLLSEDERSKPEPVALSEDWLEWNLSVVGEYLLSAEELPEQVPQEVKTAHLSLHEAGGDLLREDEKVKIDPVEVNTDHLKVEE